MYIIDSSKQYLVYQIYKYQTGFIYSPESIPSLILNNKRQKESYQILFFMIYMRLRNQHYIHYQLKWKLLR